MRFGFLRFCYYLFLSRSLLDVNCCGWSRGDSGEEHEHLSDAVLESVMVFRLAAGAVAEVVVPLGLAKAGFLSGSTGVLYFIYFRVWPSQTSKRSALDSEYASIRVLSSTDLLTL